jgi:hypothetical protein
MEKIKMKKKEDILLKEFNTFLNALNEQAPREKSAMNKRRQTFLEIFLETNKNENK